LILVALSPLLGAADIKGKRPSPKVADEALIELSFPPNVDVRVLVEYVSSRLGVNILYDDSIPKKTVTISSPTKIPKDSLMGLLQSVLKTSGLMMIDADQPGWKKVVIDKDLLGLTETIEKDPARLDKAESTTVLTQVVTLEHVQTSQVEETLRQFLSKPGGNLLSIPDQNLMIITDRASYLRRVLEILVLMDRPGKIVETRFKQIRHLEATELAKQVSSMLAEKAKVAGSQGKTPPPPAFALIPDARTNQIAIIAIEGADTDATRLIETLDVPTFQLPSPVCFYRIANVPATDVLATITALEGSENGLADIALPQQNAATNPPQREQFTGPNFPSTPSAGLPLPRSYYDANAPYQGTLRETSSSPRHLSAKTKDATIAVDTNTNTLIVVAPEAVQMAYKKLIAMLDKRRPQVMVEVTLLTLDTSNGFSLGVELGYKNFHNNAKVLTFSSFGLSKPDVTTGAMALNPGAGFNGVVVDTDTFTAIVRALATSGKTKVLSAPKLLVNDDATATLTSQAESPFTSVNASNTVATTSFAGYASAGTNLTVTPHISEGDHLQLKYTISLSSFSGSGSSSDSVVVPPPRQTNSLNSEVTVPDGYCVIIGGLNRKDQAETVSKIPILGDIPILKYLVSSRSKTDSDSTLFVFIRPTILRDDQFEDLKFFSERDLEAAKLPRQFPQNTPMLMQ
jgi:general secretion pathway protein D